MSKLSGKVAIVTGASKGIGAAIAVHLAAEGASVVVNYSSSKAGAEKVVAEITAKGGKAIAVGANVSKPEEIVHLFAESKKAYDRLDILVNNAGVYGFAPIEAITPEIYHNMFDLNVLGLLLTSKEAVKHFGKNGGTIINISSAIVSMTPPAGTVYTATKAAVDSITRSLANELGSKKIRVNAINPGLVVTEGVKTANLDTGEMSDGMVAQTPLGRLGQPDDIAKVAVFLASDESAWVTGETIFVSGGLR